MIPAHFAQTPHYHIRLAIRRAGSVRLPYLLAVASSPPDKPRKSYLIRRALSLAPSLYRPASPSLKKGLRPAVLTASAATNGNANAIRQRSFHFSFCASAPESQPR